MSIAKISPALATTLCEKLRALSDENRMKIMLLLRDGERCVCDIVDSLGLPQSLVSHHLAVMRSAGLLHDRRSGKWVYYSINKESITQLDDLFHEVFNPAEISTERAQDCDVDGRCGS